MISPRPQQLLKIERDSSEYLGQGNKINADFKFELNDFKESFDKFLKTGTNICNNVHKNDIEHPCHVALSNMNNLIVRKMIKCKNEKEGNPAALISEFYENLRKLIVQFADEYSDYLIEEPWNSKGEYNDKWIKIQTYLKGPGLENEITGSNPVTEERCRGVVIYFSENLKFFSVSIPISELYFCVLEKKSENKKIYYEFYLYLYYMLYYSVPEEDPRRDYFLNVIKLCSFKYYSKPDLKYSGSNSLTVKNKKKGKNKNDDGYTGIISKIVDVADNFGYKLNKEKILNTVNNFDTQKFTDTTKKILEPFSNFDISTSEDPVGEIFDKVGEICNDKTIKDNVITLSGTGKELLKEYKEEIDNATHLATSTVQEFTRVEELDSDNTPEDNDELPPPLESTD